MGTPWVLCCYLDTPFPISDSGFIIKYIKYAICSEQYMSSDVELKNPSLEIDQLTQVLKCHLCNNNKNNYHGIP